MTEWTFQNTSKENGPKIPVQSIAHAVELVMTESGEFSPAPSMNFCHADRGVICITAGHEYGVISFDPNYDFRAPHTLRGFMRVQPNELLTPNHLETYDDACGASTIWSHFLISILDVIKVLEYILEHHDYPSFVDWKPGA